MIKIKIKVLLAAGALIVPLVTLAGQTRVSCVTEMATTSFVLVEEKASFDLHIIHHNGVEYMPIHSGIVTPKFLPKLLDRSEKLQKMGSHAIAKFQKEKCSNNGILWRCYLHSPTRLGELQVESVGFAMGSLSSDYDGMKWKSTETFLHLKIDNENITLSMSYPEGSCREGR